MAADYGADMMEANVQDPDVKLVLTERELDKWVRWFKNHVAINVLEYLGPAEARVARCSEPQLYHFVRLISTLYSAYRISILYRQLGNEESCRPGSVVTLVSTRELPTSKPRLLS